ncbi:DUF4301 family protein [Winogradskyella ursingii]|uniref:DUF4301 family protein n=1 Tax=Winogradskyella ursingii TaxID=2686079 RepID=UPI0015C8505B|nr:DUF4301 family protein [Winogradskyella ursingii]
MNFTQKDLNQIENKGLSAEKVKSQVETFKKGIPFTQIVEAATVGNGIIKLNDELIDNSIELFEERKSELSLLKFVPASGAATRMFKFLFQFLEDYNPEDQSINAYINKNDLKNMSVFVVGMEKFPFYNKVLAQLDLNGVDFENLNDSEKVYHFVKTMLDADMLNFGNWPKGLLPFHRYKNNISTAFEEHLYETALYAGKDKQAHLHFTISEQHEEKFKNEFKAIQNTVEEKTGVDFNISFSYQQSSTDTIAVTPNDEPFRNDDGSILFRPSGHGALITNLNALNADVIFVKNIDNVVVYKYKDEVAKYKKVLAGILLKLQEKSFQYLRQLESNSISENDIHEMVNFISKKLNVRTSDEFEKYSDQNKIEYLKEKLNRPIRVCGMVKNEGEPGGGPFWIKDKKGNESLQIVESAQIDLDNKQQKNILQNATHFNPVDLVCGVKNHQGKPFDLENYVNHDAAFITSKTKAGKELKALELPGLWNGSMAYWNTIFVEVPIITFNPVKTVNDLLKAPHQIKA